MKKWGRTILKGELTENLNLKNLIFSSLRGGSRHPFGSWFLHPLSVTPQPSAKQPESTREPPDSALSVVPTSVPGHLSPPFWSKRENQGNPYFLLLTHQPAPFFCLKTKTRAPISSLSHTRRQPPLQRNPTPSQQKSAGGPQPWKKKAIADPPFPLSSLKANTLSATEEESINGGR